MRACVCVCMCVCVCVCLCVCTCARVHVDEQPSRSISSDVLSWELCKLGCMVAICSLSLSLSHSLALSHSFSFPILLRSPSSPSLSLLHSHFTLFLTKFSRWLYHSYSLGHGFLYIVPSLIPHLFSLLSHCTPSFLVCSCRLSGNKMFCWL